MSGDSLYGILTGGLYSVNGTEGMLLGQLNLGGITIQIIPPPPPPVDDLVRGRPGGSGGAAPSYEDYYDDRHKIIVTIKLKNKSYRKEFYTDGYRASAFAYVLNITQKSSHYIKAMVLNVGKISGQVSIANLNKIQNNILTFVKNLKKRK